MRIHLESNKPKPVWAWANYWMRCLIFLIKKKIGTLISWELLWGLNEIIHFNTWYSIEQIEIFNKKMNFIITIIEKHSIKYGYLLLSPTVLIIIILHHLNSGKKVKRQKFYSRSNRILKFLTVPGHQLGAGHENHRFCLVSLCHSLVSGTIIFTASGFSQTQFLINYAINVSCVHSF